MKALADGVTDAEKAKSLLEDYLKAHNHLPAKGDESRLFLAGVEAAHGKAIRDLCAGLLVTGGRQVHCSPFPPSRLHSPPLPPAARERAGRGRQEGAGGRRHGRGEGRVSAGGLPGGAQLPARQGR